MAETNEGLKRISPAQWGVIALVIALTSEALLYRYLRHERLGQSAAMFVGIPAILAIVLALTPKAKSVTGGILKGITLGLLIVAPLLGEGFLCILIASPLFYVVGIVIGLIVDSSRKKRAATLSCVSLVLVPMCLEGVVPQLTRNRVEVVEVARLVDAPASAVETALSQSPNLETPLPRYLRIGFPRPLEAHGAGLTLGSTRTIHFAGAEGDPPGDLVVRVEERGPGFVRLETVSDASKLTQWIRWDSSEVRWFSVDATHTQVVWRIAFERQLDPAWYFTPWERAAVRDAASYMIAANATPKSVKQQ
jgi:hypothetical protein